MIRKDHASLFSWSAIGRKPGATFADRAQGWRFVLDVRQPARLIRSQTQANKNVFQKAPREGFDDGTCCIGDRGNTRYWRCDQQGAEGRRLQGRGKLRR